VPFNETGTEMFPSLQQPGMNPLLYLNPQIMESIQAFPDVGIRPGEFYNQRALTGADEAFSQWRQSAVDITKATMAGGIMKAAGIGSIRFKPLGVSLPDSFLHKKVPFASRMVHLGAQSYLDLYNFLGGKQQGFINPLSGRSTQGLGAGSRTYTRQVMSGRMSIGGRAKAGWSRTWGRIRGAVTGNNPVQRGGGPLSRWLSYMLPKGTGMKSMLFWNLMSGDFEENFATYGSTAGQFLKFGLMAQVTNFGGKYAASVMRGGMTVALGGAGTAAGDLAGRGYLQEAMGIGLREPTRFLTEAERSRMSRGALELTQVPGREGAAGTKLKQRWNAVKAKALRSGVSGSFLLGTGLRVANFMGGVSAATAIAGAWNKYRLDMAGTMRKEALSYETAFADIPQIPEASSERQRAIEAMQSSAMNLRSYWGNEAQMMHA